MKKLAAPLLTCLLLTACATRVEIPEAQRTPGVPLFSQTTLGPAVRPGWTPWIMSRFSARTQYQVVDSDVGRVLKADASASSTGLIWDVNINPAATPLMSWTWKASNLIPDADTSLPGNDDSPARVAVAFDGDRSKFDLEERAMASLVRVISGREMPYATLIYVWDNKLPVDSVFEHPRSSRVRVIVVESGPKRVGQWIKFNRDVEADYRRAFGEAPGRIESVGVLTDTNSTGHKVTSYYGDIEFHAPIAAQAHTVAGR